MYVRVTSLAVLYHFQISKRSVEASWSDVLLNKDRRPRGWISFYLGELLDWGPYTIFYYLLISWVVLFRWIRTSPFHLFLRIKVIYWYYQALIFVLQVTFITIPGITAALFVVWALLKSAFLLSAFQYYLCNAAELPVILCLKYSTSIQPETVRH